MCLVLCSGVTPPSLNAGGGGGGPGSSASSVDSHQPPTNSAHASPRTQQQAGFAAALRKLAKQAEGPGACARVVSLRATVVCALMHDG